MAVEPAAISAKPARTMMWALETAPERPAASANGTVSPSETADADVAYGGGGFEMAFDMGRGDANDIVHDGSVPQGRRLVA